MQTYAFTQDDSLTDIMSYRLLEVLNKNTSFEKKEIEYRKNVSRTENYDVCKTNSLRAQGATLTIKDFVISVAPWKGNACDDATELRAAYITQIEEALVELKKDYK